jgi:hypothetical protein
MARLTIDSRKDCYLLDPAKIEALQRGKNTISLNLGTYEIRIRSGDFSYRSSGGSGSEALPEAIALPRADRPFPAEPWVMLWMYGGKVINEKTGVAVGCTWSSLNGYEDVLHLRVIEPASVSAMFLDTHVQDNRGTVLLSVRKTD